MIIIEPTIDGIELIYPNGKKKTVKIDSDRQAFISDAKELLNGVDGNGNSYQLDCTIVIDGVGLGYADLLAEAGFVFKTKRTMNMPEFLKVKSLLKNNTQS